MNDDTKSETGATKPGARGISYPFMSLEEAVAQAHKFYLEERKSAVPVVVAMKHFGYGEKSSGGRQTVSALIQFGLLADEGIKDKRVVRLTDRALTILLDEVDSPDRDAALKQAVRGPRIYSELIAKWPDGLPSEHNLTYYLKKEKDFNPKTLESFISDFKKSLAFAKFTIGATIVSPKTPALDSNLHNQPAPSPTPSVKVGDYVQWESGGVVQFEPRPVFGVSEDGQYAFVTGANSGIPIKELTVMQQPLAPLPNQPINTLPPTIKTALGSRQDTFSLDEGNVVLQWPDKMSQESFEDFEAWMQIQLRKIKRSIN